MRSGRRADRIDVWSGTAQAEPELRELINATRLERVFPDLPFDADRFSKFRWLVVEEEIALDPRLAARASPLLFKIVLIRSRLWTD